MRTAKKLGVAACVAALSLPAIAQGGERPPGDAYYYEGINVVQADKSGKKVDIGVGIYECGNETPFSIEGLKVSKDGKYEYSGKAKNASGDKYKLTVDGEVKSAKKVVQKTTIKDGSCKESEKITLKGDN